MPGPEVKNWKQYEALRKQGYSKSSAARIANSRAGTRKQRKKRRRKKGRR